MRLVLVGEQPYTAVQIGEVTGLEVAAVLPADADEPTSDPFAPAKRRTSTWNSAIDRLASLATHSVGGQQRSEHVEQHSVVVDPVVPGSRYPQEA